MLLLLEVTLCLSRMINFSRGNYVDILKVQLSILLLLSLKVSIIKCLFMEMCVTSGGSLWGAHSGSEISGCVPLQIVPIVEMTSILVLRVLTCHGPPTSQCYDKTCSIRSLLRYRFSICFKNSNLIIIIIVEPKPECLSLKR